MLKITMFITGKKYINILRAGSILILIAFAAAIYLFSSQQGIQSNKLTGEITKDIREHITLPSTLRSSGLFNNLNYNLILRKLLHFAGYSFLALILYAVLRLWNVKKQISICITLLLCLIYALVDELHQGFVPGRTGRYQDVLIDFSGAVLAVSLIKIFRKRNRIKHTAKL